MYWLKRDMWKAGIVLAGMLLLFVLMVWLLVPVAEAQGGSSGPATPGTVPVQTTPTVDATATALNKEKLQHENDWWWNYGAMILTSIISTLTLAAAGVFTVVRYFNDRRDTREKQEAEAKRLADDRKAEREKRAEERFQAAVIGLGDEKEEAKINAAILLRTFLRPDHEQFYTQTFDLAVAHLRLPRNPDRPPTLSQALIVAFKESFPLARDRLKAGNSQFNPQSLDASGTRLDNANLNFADLEQVWMPVASLRKASLFKANLIGANLAGANLSRANLIEAKLNSNGTSLNKANLSGANLNKADLSQAYLIETDLSQAYLSEANFSKASLLRANLSGANLGGANLSQADLSQANFSQSRLFGANLSESNLSGADLSNADLRYANLSKIFLFETNLSGADLSNARLFDNATNLERTDLRGVKGLTREQLEACKAKGAIIDEDITVSSSQLPVSPPPSSQSTDTQALSAPPAQESTQTLDAGGSNAASF